jgi:hypothetical protein
MHDAVTLNMGPRRHTFPDLKVPTIGIERTGDAKDRQ